MAGWVMKVVEVVEVGGGEHHVDVVVDEVGERTQFTVARSSLRGYPDCVPVGVSLVTLGDVEPGLWWVPVGDVDSSTNWDDPLIWEKETPVSGWCSEYEFVFVCEPFSQIVFRLDAGKVISSLEALQIASAYLSEDLADALDVLRAVLSEAEYEGK